MGEPRATRLLTLLLPVRNAESTLEAWLADAAELADDVIALDDGSTDRTRAILESSDIVSHVIPNPRRTSYAGWDDHNNRQRLLDAAVRGSSRWLMFLDADERLDTSDAEALRRFLADEAVGGAAYGFEVFRMVEDRDHFDPKGYWVYRLFARHDGESSLPSQRLHFVPVPVSIPRSRWLQTSIRIQHFGSLTAEHRRRRFFKYREADPGDAYDQSYASLLAEPSHSLEWRTRSRDLPVLLGNDGRFADLLGVPPPGREIAVSAVVIAQDDREVIDRSITALLDQDLDESFEVILVGSGKDGTVAHVRDHYPTVRCVQLPDYALPGKARNTGLWMARGHYVTFPGSHVWLSRGSLRARVEAHDQGWDMVTGAVKNGNESPAGWASYFLDHAAQMPSRASGELVGVPGHASYATADIWGIGGFPEDMRAGEDTVANRALYHAGRTSYYEAAASFYHASPCETVSKLIGHHFKRGRGLGRIIRDTGTRSRIGAILASGSYPIRRLNALRDGIEGATGETLTTYRRVRPLIHLGVAASALGTWFELLRSPQPGPVLNRHNRSSPATAAGPVVAIGGRPDYGAHGLLSAGSPRQVAERAISFVQMTASETAVAALAPVVTSTTVTAEEDGTYTTHLRESVLDQYLDAARSVGAMLLLQIQPGLAPLHELLERWSAYTSEPDVGVIIDIRDGLALAGQDEELADVATEQMLPFRSSSGRHAIAVRGAGNHSIPTDALRAEFIDLRCPTARLPHELVASGTGADLVVYS